MLPARQHLWAVRVLSILDGGDRLGRAAVRRDAQDSLASLADDNAVWPPVDADRVVDRTQRHGGTARDGDSLQRPIAGCEEDDRSAIRRKDRLVHNLIPVGARNQLRLKVRHRSNEQAIARHIHELRAIRRQGKIVSTPGHRLQSRQVEGQSRDGPRRRGASEGPCDCARKSERKRRDDHRHGPLAKWNRPLGDRRGGGW
jgi:hypothetical protein